ncbi:MAG: ABC transporter ATP-binding protein [Lentisphaerae bacterium GWF2_44_16]|nr:MAG: ABC transporter ATP-binding protein [Lentisphaerae bacterium GWF2_44_16]
MLELINIYKTFNACSLSEVKSLVNFSLKINKGDFVTVIGTNGSGKSTLQNIISGTISPDSGSILIDNANVTNWREDKRASLIGRVFQNPFTGTAPGMTIAENLALAALRGKIRGLRWALRKKLVAQMKEKLSTLKMGIEDRLDAPVGTLSGGQRQAITLLMASWLEPKIFLLDEHTAALDPKSAEKIINLTKEIVESRKLTTLMVTHSMQQAANLGNRLIMMHRGRLVRDIQGEERNRLKTDDLLNMFEELRLLEQLDESAAEMLQENYI